MTVQPTDRDWGRLDVLVDEDPIALRDAAWRLATALAAAEHRIARLEAQTDIRGRAIVMYRERAREAEAELDSWMARAYEAEGKLWKAEKRLAGWMEHWNATARTGAVDEVAAVLEANARADQAEARIRAVKDVLAHHPYGGPEQEDAIRQALDGDA